MRKKGTQMKGYSRVGSSGRSSRQKLVAESTGPGKEQCHQVLGCEQLQQFLGHQSLEQVHANRQAEAGGGSTVSILGINIINDSHLGVRAPALFANAAADLRCAETQRFQS